MPSFSWDLPEVRISLGFAAKQPRGSINTLCQPGPGRGGLRSLRVLSELGRLGSCGDVFRGPGGAAEARRNLMNRYAMQGAHHKPLVPFKQTPKHQKREQVEKTQAQIAQQVVPLRKFLFPHQPFEDLLKSSLWACVGQDSSLERTREEQMERRVGVVPWSKPWVWTCIGFSLVLLSHQWNRSPFNFSNVTPIWAWFLC